MTEIIRSTRVYLRPLTEVDATARYAAWLNDPDVNRYLETRHGQQTVESCKRFIDDCNRDSCSHLFGVFLLENDAHVGNAKIGSVNPYHQRGQVSLFIGEKSQWGKGLGREVVTALTRYGFEVLKLQRLEAGCYSQNKQSLRLFQSVGYIVEGRFRDHFELDGDRMDSIWLGILSGEFKT